MQNGKNRGSSPKTRSKTGVARKGMLRFNRVPARIDKGQDETSGRSYNIKQAEDLLKLSDPAQSTEEKGD